MIITLRGGVPLHSIRHQIWQKEANANRLNLFDLSLNARREGGGLQKDRVTSRKTSERRSEI